MEIKQDMYILLFIQAWVYQKIKCWMELSSLVARLGSTLSTNVLSFQLITDSY